ncbi:hypothetical protein ACJ41O_012136 [Fusarium nematophilum]
MTGRGKAGNPGPPVPPPRDPTLETRPVPRERQFPVRSLGPGAAPDIRTTVQPIRESKERVSSEAYDDKYGDVISLLRAVDENLILSLHWDGSRLDDPTWGIYVFVTAYSAAAMENLAQAVSKVAEALRRSLAQEA